MSHNHWYIVNNADAVDTPALLVYEDRVRENIKIVKSFVDNVDRLRPHVKTHKSPGVVKLLLQEGIQKFKCATIAEAEMLAMTGAKDILLAYQPVGPKAERFGELVKKYGHTKFSCLIDNLRSARHLSSVLKAIKPLDVFIDLNVGMNRTGIMPDEAPALFEACSSLPGINIVGLHAYDGHIRDSDLKQRTSRCDEAFQNVEQVKASIESKVEKKLIIIAGGTPTFPIHAKRKNVECSPGTFIYWDKGYQSILAEQPFVFAAVVVTRVISKPDGKTVCVDLGHKSVASENPLNSRIYFLNAQDVEPIGHSEEHLVLKTQEENNYQVGDIFYGIPHHICPTVALYDEAVVIKNHLAAERWSTTSRKRKITI